MSQEKEEEDSILGATEVEKFETELEGIYSRNLFECVIKQEGCLLTKEC